MKYRIIRFYADRNIPPRTIHRGLTLEEAQEHCSSPDTSSTTCKTKVGKARTRKIGGWFDGYDEDN